MEREEMERLAAGTDNISEKIRILFRAGAERSEIAAFLGRKYQQVHNVLKRGGLLEAQVADRPVSNREDGVLSVVILEAGNRIALPDDFVSNAGLREGEELVCRVEADRLTILTRDAAARLLLEAAQRHMPGQAGLLEALLARDPRATRTGTQKGNDP